jgi:serine/threonine protein kinase
VPAIPPFKQQQAEAKNVIKESKGGPSPPISASNTFIKDKGLSPAFVAQYDILDELGSGGFGFVVRARRKRDGFIVAVKFIFRERVSLST